MLLRELVEGGEHLAAKFDRGFNSQRHPGGFARCHLSNRLDKLEYCTLLESVFQDATQHSSEAPLRFS
jgi:hypothetical protein